MSHNFIRFLERIRPNNTITWHLRSKYVFLCLSVGLCVCACVMYCTLPSIVHDGVESVSDGEDGAVLKLCPDG